MAYKELGKTSEADGHVHYLDVSVFSWVYTYIQLGLCTLNICSTLHIDYTSVKLLKHPGFL